MKALVFSLSYPRLAAAWGLGKLSSSAPWGALGPISLKQISEPALPAEDWVKVETALSGICGSDMKSLKVEYTPNVLVYQNMKRKALIFGHEVVGTVIETGPKVDKLNVGDRVIIDAMAGCIPRGLEPCAQCQKGLWSICERLDQSGTYDNAGTGFNYEIGGGWGERFVAHQSRAHRLPDAVDFRSALAVEPFACGLHGVLPDPPKPGSRVLVIGAGTLGLGSLAALHALELDVQPYLLCKYPFQKEQALRICPNVRIIEPGDDVDERIAEALGAQVLKPMVGRPLLEGGFEYIIDTISNKTTTAQSLSWLRARGQLLVVGTAGLLPFIDWTRVWLRELTVRGTMAYASDPYKGQTRSTFEIALELLDAGKVDLSAMVTHVFPQEQYAQAFDTFDAKNANQAVKVAFGYGEQLGS